MIDDEYMFLSKKKNKMFHKFAYWMNLHDDCGIVS